MTVQTQEQPMSASPTNSSASGPWLHRWDTILIQLLLIALDAARRAPELPLKSGDCPRGIRERTLKLSRDGIESYRNRGGRH